MEPNPFVAVSGTPPKVFSGRSGEEATFRRNLQQAHDGRVEHAVVLGDWGIGKTSLLRQFKHIAQLAESRTALIPIPRGDFGADPAEGIRLIVEELTLAFYPKQNRLGRIRQVEFQVLGTGGGMTLADRDNRPPQILLTECLQAVWRRIAGRRRLNREPVVIMIDDIQNFAAIPDAVDILRLVLQREEVQEMTRFMFVLSSTPTAWSEFTNKHDPIGRFFRTRMPLARLDRTSMEQVVLKTLEGTGVTFAPELLPKIYEYCNGHPYELQVLCGALYEQQYGGRVVAEGWHPARLQALRELGMSHFNSQIHQASDQERLALWVIAQVGGGPLGHIRGAAEKRFAVEIGEQETKQIATNLNQLVSRLVDKGLLTRPSRGVYEIDDPMLRDYVLDVLAPDGR